MLSVEDLLRQTIATLEETGELKNTYIFFTSDNGFHMGNHRLAPGEQEDALRGGHRGALDGARPWGTRGAVRQELVINNDFAPTIATSPVPPPRRSSTVALSPRCLAPRRRPPGDKAFLEEGWLPATIAVPTHKGVHTQDHMFVEYDTGEHELYDLRPIPTSYRANPERATSRSTPSCKLSLTP